MSDFTLYSKIFLCFLLITSIAEFNSTGSKNYYLSDHLGSTSVLVNSSGKLIEKTRYDPFGSELAGGNKSKYGYNGKEEDVTTGLLYYGARYYNPTLKRWIQPDPIIQDIFDPQTLNRYSYVKNNPMRYTDPTGNVYLSPPACAAVLGYTLGAFLVGSELRYIEGLHTCVTNEKMTRTQALTSLECHSRGFSRAVDKIQDSYFASTGFIRSIPPSGGQKTNPGYEITRTDIEPSKYNFVSKGASSLSGSLMLESEPISRGFTGLGKWGSAEKEQDHFIRHGIGVGAITKSEYSQMSAAFLQNSIGSNEVLTKVSSEGVLRIVDPNSRYFGSYTPSGGTKSFYQLKPHIDPVNYYNQQEGIQIIWTTEGK